MKKYLTIAMFVVLAVVLVSPFSVSAKTKAGVKSGSFFYFFDKTFEKANLFFTFSPEKKAKKAMENAEERLAEAEESASENDTEAVAEAMENYQKNIKVLEKVLAKVPEEAKQAIEKAIEADKERREEMTKKIEEINNEIKNKDDDFKKDEEEKSNDDVGDNESDEEENGNGNKDEQSKEIEKLKKEVETLKQKQPQVKIIEKIIEKEKPIVIEKKESSSSQTKQNENIITLPNGSVVEMDENGNVVRTIKEAPQKAYTVPAPTTSSQTSSTIQIQSVNVIPAITTTKIEWQTNKPTESKLFLSGGNFSSKVYTSLSNLSTRHFVDITGLSRDTTYSYEIEAIVHGGVTKRSGVFSTFHQHTDLSEEQYVIEKESNKSEIIIWNQALESDRTPACNVSGSFLSVAVLGADGESLNVGTEIEISAPDLTADFITKRKTNTTYGELPQEFSKYKKALYFSSFWYCPTVSGTKNVTFLANGMSKTITVEIK